MILSFNLIQRPFIPCVQLDGQTAQYSLLDVLLKAHQIAELRDGSPLVTAALHRLLLAILHRCYRGPTNSAERVAIHKAGRFDAGRINAYFQEWVDRFDLFHEEYPFFQRAGFSTKKPSSINRLYQELSRGNNAALFDHTSDDPPPVLTPAEVARAVIAEQAFAVGGGKSPTGNLTHAPLVSGATVLVRGRTLFESLWLNLTLYDGDQEPIACAADDAPVWEQAPVKPHKESATPRGYLDYLTWQSRTLRVHPEKMGSRMVVRHVSYSQGRKLEIEPGFYDPMLAYFRNEETGDLPVRLSEDRDLWRASAALFQFAETDPFRGPSILYTLACPELKEVLSPAARYQVSVIGLCTNKAKVHFWRHETLPLPLTYLDNVQRVEALKQALGMAEAVAAEAVRSAAWVAAANRLAANQDMKPDTDQVRMVVDSFAPLRLYWSRLELPFRDLLVSLAADKADLQACLRCWYWDCLDRTARDAFEQSIGRLDGGRDLKAVTAGRGLLFYRLKKIREVNHISDQERQGVA
jgi:CRISPR system Cascade subunit CasA